MIDVLSIGIALAVLLIAFWVTEWQTGYFSTHYYFQIVLLFTIGGAAGVLCTRLWDSQIGFAIAFLGLALFHIGLAFGKLIIESDSKYRRQHKAERALVRYDGPHQAFTLRTTDGVTLHALSLNHGRTEKTDNAIIVCHGAGRSKNTLAVAQTAQLLATRYDVFAFDLRGHMQSSGVFRGDGETALDLDAMIAHIESQGYKKIGVFGWSVGAWTALLCASRGAHIDTLIAGSPPPISMGSLGLIRLLKRFDFISIPVLGGVAVIRNMRTPIGAITINVLDFVQKIHDIPILLVYNDVDVTVGVEASAFEQLYEKLPEPKSKLHLPGHGHLFDWPNTYTLWGKMFEWFEQTL